MIESQPYYINLELSGFDEFSELSKQFKWNLEFKKLNVGSFSSHTQMISFDKVQIGKTKLSSTLLQNGQSPCGYRTFVLFANDTQSLVWLKRKVNTKDLIVYREDNFWESVSHDGFDMFTIDIEQEYLRSMIEESGGLLKDKNLRADEMIISMDTVTLLKIRQFLNQLFYKLERNALNIHSPKLRHHIIHKLPKLLLHIVNGCTENVHQKRRKRDIAVEKAVSFINETLYDKISMPELCTYANVSERTLEYGFQQKFSVSPIQFIKASKLYNVRQEIMLAKKGYSISEIAQKHGFKHLGQFAKDYKNLFGESPSTTIANIKYD